MGSNSGQPEPCWLQAERDRDNDATFEGLCDQQEHIETREDLASFIEALHNDLRTHPTWWENANLVPYLDALAAVVASLGQGYKNRRQVLPEQPTWRLVGEMLLTARIYE